MKRKKSIETYILFITAALSGLISLLDLFGLLDVVPWLANQVATLTLLLVSGLVAYMASGLAGKLDSIEEITHHLQTQIQQDVTEKISSLRQQMDPNLEVVFGDHVSDILSSVEKLLKQRSLQLHDVDLFRYFYKRTLEKYPRATFFATSLPYQSYFWKNQSMEQAMARFIANGGKIKRIFFLRDPQEVRQEDVREVLSTQCQIGVEAYVAEIDKSPLHLRKFFVVEEKGRIAWEVFVGANNEITSIMATSDPTQIEKYIRIFKELREIDGTRRYNIEKI